MLTSIVFIVCVYKEVIHMNNISYNLHKYYEACYEACLYEATI